MVVLPAAILFSHSCHEHAASVVQGLVYYVRRVSTLRHAKESKETDLPLSYINISSPSSMTHSVLFATPVPKEHAAAAPSYAFSCLLQQKQQCNLEEEKPFSLQTYTRFVELSRWI